MQCGCKVPKQRIKPTLRTCEYAGCGVALPSRTGRKTNMCRRHVAMTQKYRLKEK